MKEIKPKIQLSYKEYIESITVLLEQLFNDIRTEIQFEDEIYDQAFDSKLFVFLVSSTNVFLTNESKVSKKIVKDIEEDVVESFLSKLTDNAPTKTSWKNFYDKYSKVIKEVMEKSGEGISQEQQLVGFSQILLDGITIPKEDKQQLLEKLSIKIQGALLPILKLAKNTGLSPKLMGKPNFMILRD